MALSEQDRERQSDEVYTDRLIRGSVYCGNCGYNLRTLPYIYQCPECGNHYNARPLTMKGVFLPQQAEPPIGQVLFLFACICVAVVMFYGAFQPSDIWRLLGGTILTIFSVVECPKAWSNVRKFFMARAIIRRINRDEE